MNGELTTMLLDAIRNDGIEPTEAEMEYFGKHIARHLWNSISAERAEAVRKVMASVESTPIRFPNGRVGEEYNIEIPFNIDGVAEYSIDGLDATGLAWRKTDVGFCIEGKATPDDTKGGDFPIVLRYRPESLLDGEQWPERELKLILNPDPRSLWREVPTPDSIDYYKPDTQTESLIVEGSKGVIAASRRGRSHAHEGKPRDDHFQLHYCEASGWYVIAVADGAGSAQYSREGSRLACEAAVNHCVAILSDSAEFDEAINASHANADDMVARKKAGDLLYAIVGNAAFKAHNVIKTEAQRKEASVKDYATTLLLVVCRQFDFGWVVGSFWVGDGAMCVYNAENHKVELLGTPDEGEYAGQTRFLTMQEVFDDRQSFYRRLRLRVYPEFTALMLMTDGVSDPKFESDAGLSDPARWDALWTELTAAGATDHEERLLDWLNFWAQGSHDDRTIAILH